MSVSNCIKIRVLGSESTGYLFKASSCDAAFVISSKHGLCHQKENCEPFKAQIASCCRKCDIQPELSGLSFDSMSTLLEAESLYSFPDKDLVITRVSGKATHPMRIGEIENISGKTFYLNAFKEKDTEPGRLMLNFPQPTPQGLINYNIESNSTPELIEKSIGYKGVSGGLVLEYPESDFPVAHAVIIENGKNNDLIAESLNDIDHDVINDFFDCVIFHKPVWTVKLDNSIEEYVKEILRKEITKDFEIVTYIPIHNGFPHFDLNPIAKFLLIEFNYMLTTNNMLTSQSVARAGMLLSKEITHEPANKLLTGRLVETFLNAPHLYSTGLTAKYYHHMHYMITNDGNGELAFSSYCGHNNLVEDLNNEVEKVISNFNYYGFNQDLFLERSFLTRKLPESECETLFKVLLNGKKNINTFCLVFTLSMESYNKENFETVSDYIISIVNNACDSINQDILKTLSTGIKLNLIIVPSNRVNELSQVIIRELFGDD